MLSRLREDPAIKTHRRFDQFTPTKQPTEDTLESFVTDIAQWLVDTRPADPKDAIRAVFMVLSKVPSIGGRNESE
ncbi:hypothetical protein C7476_101695 [Phyllobacterium bourgognense]|uniref:Uncharacterized protein n=1 Tax=Phyllobacterium bourgognense TaxID=314236 RepID=A0A368Z8U8_9HYPH|nr:hypothetical protein C7476_101695 [Phyllobacterium bourgognense]